MLERQFIFVALHFTISWHIYSKQKASDRKQLSIYSKTPAAKLHIVSAFATNFPAVRSSRSIIYFSFKFTIHKD